MSVLNLFVDAPDAPPGALVPVELLDLDNRRSFHTLARTGTATPIHVADAAGPMHIQAVLANGQVLSTDADARDAGTVVLTSAGGANVGEEGFTMSEFAGERGEPQEYHGAWARLWRRRGTSWALEPAELRDVLIDRTGLHCRMWQAQRWQSSALQVGGDAIAERSIMLPPATDVRVTLARTGQSDTHDFGGGYTVTARTGDEHAEALLAHCSAGQLTAARTIAANYLPAAEKTLYAPRPNPLPAIVGGYYLLRTHAVEQMHDWARTLSHSFPGLPDAAVVRIGQLLLSSQPDPKEVQMLLIHAIHAGLPSYTDGLRWLYRAAELLLAANRADKQLQAAHSWLRRYADAADWDAVLTGFRGDPTNPTVERRTGRPNGREGGEALIPLAPT